VRPRLTPKESNAVKRIAALIIVNAMIFHEVLAKKERRVKPLRRFRGRPKVVTALAQHWKFVLDEINYYPIFHVAHELLSGLAADPDITEGVEALMDTALQIVGWRAALRHDLAGRIYHRLLSEAKHLGAYYTAIPSATLLLKLALQPEGYDRRWDSIEELKELRVADFACGTGTLLMAAADTILDNYFRACAERREPTDPDLAHSAIVENAIWGFDVLPSALHLTASSLSLRVPDVPINVTNLYSFALGGRSRALGSLEFLEKQEVGTRTSLFGDRVAPEQVHGRGTRSRDKVKMPQLDLCVMNPPFVRSVGGNLLFGNLPAPERAAMQTRLKRMVKDQDARANITAGLGSVFVAVGHRFVKPGGRIALVLPRGLLSGVAWNETRDLIRQYYDLEYVIVSHQADHWNFSENTDLSETMIVARKRKVREGSPRPVCCVNLWEQPRNAVEALGLAASIQRANPPDLSTGQGAAPLRIGSRKVGEAVSVPWPKMMHASWGFPCAFAQVDLNRLFDGLMESRLRVPGQRGVTELPLTPLSRLGNLGFDRRDIHDGFDLAQEKTTYAAFWSHETDSVTCMQQSPNQYLAPLAQAKEKRNLRRPADLWAKAARLLLAERLWLNTVRVTAVRLSEQVLSNVWWTVALRVSRGNVDAAEKALALWLNGTLGGLSLIAHREETRGGWVQFKKPVLERMPVLDVAHLQPKTLTSLAAAYDDLCQENLHRLPAIAGDETRGKIDHAIEQALGLPHLSILRELLSREPIICLTNERLTGAR
jgi:hypothetical protein